MTILAIGLFAVLAVTALFQSIFAFIFARLLNLAAPLDVPCDTAPHASILLSLRGADPGLEDNISRLLQQDYPSYDLRIVVDSQDDPAWNVVNKIAQRLGTDKLHLSTLRDRRRTCSLSNSALCQSVSGLDDRCEIVVIVDGDLVAHRTCLRELVAPFRDDSVGASFGNRWFMPPDTSWGSWVRYLWNVAAVVPMYWFNIPWGGCFAIRRSAIDASGLLNIWQHAMVEDAPTKAAFSKLGLTLQFVPSLMMVNRERCGFRFAHNFIHRQMIWTRLYHPNFTPVLLHAMVTTFLIGTAIVLTTVCLATGHLQAALWASASLGFYLCLLLAAIYILEKGVRRVLWLRKDRPAGYKTIALIRLPAGILITQCVYLSAILKATFRRSVTWRGVRYSWKSPNDITLIDDVSVIPKTTLRQSNVSL